MLRYSVYVGPVRLKFPLCAGYRNNTNIPAEPGHRAERDGDPAGHTGDGSVGGVHTVKG